MKTLLLTTLAFSGLTVAALAQGTVQWNGAGPLFIAQTNSTVYSPFILPGSVGTGFGSVGVTTGNTASNNLALGYQGYDFELLVSSNSFSPPATIPQLLSWADTGLSATNSANSTGRLIQTAVGSVANNSQAPANGWPAGTTENVILVGWSANLGSTYAGALGNLENWDVAANGIFDSAYFGVSSMGTLASFSGNPGVIVFGSGTGQINNSPFNTPAGTPMQMYVLPVPEPGTLALAALGGASLLLFRLPRKRIE